MDLYRDPATMDPEELRAYLSDVRCELETLNEDEPEDETSEEFVDWAEEHEALEDLADEIIDRLESLGEPLEYSCKTIIYTMWAPTLRCSHAPIKQPHAMQK